MKLHPDSQAVRCRKKLNLASAALTACCFFSSSSSSSSIGPSLSMVIESIRLPGRVECNTGVDSAQRQGRAHGPPFCGKNDRSPKYGICLLYTSDAADDLLCVDLGGRRIIKKKKIKKDS